MNLEWDEAKNEANFRKHGIRFQEAGEIFDGPVLTARDDRKDYGERRFVSIGQLGETVVVVVVHTPRSGKTRLISARKANSNERQRYYESITTKTKAD